MGASGTWARLLTIAVSCGWLVNADPQPNTPSTPESVGFPHFTTESARTYLDTVAIAFTTQTGNQVEPCFIRARFHSHLGQQDEAERWARTALALDDQRADIHLFLGDLFIRQSRLDDAQESLRAALTANPELEGAQRRLGMVLDQLGDRSSAQSAFEAAIRTDPGDPSARLLLGRLLMDEGDLAGALPHLEKACELDPDSANPFYALAQALLRSGESDRAQGALRVFKELKQKEQASADVENEERDDALSMRILGATFHTEFAAYFIDAGQPTAAEEHLRQAITITPDQPLGYEILAAFLLQTDRRKDALEVCRTLVRLRPENSSYRLNLGTLLLELREFPAAVQELERAIELDPLSPEPLQNLARFYLGTRQEPARALKFSRRLVQLAPTAAHYDLLAWASFANGLTAEARSASAQSVELDPSNAVYRERLRRLQQLP